MKNSFSINILFLVLSMVGICMVPLLSIQLYPANEQNFLYVTYSWGEVSAEIVEKEVTSPLEGALSVVKGLDEITSSSSKGYGQITLRFKKGTDIDATRFEIGSLIRHVYKKLPEGVSRPSVSGRTRNGGNENLLLTYTLNGEGSSLILQQFAEDHLIPSIALIDNVSRVEATGATPQEWEVCYDAKQMANLNLSTNELTAAIQNHLMRLELGSATFEEHNDTTHLFLSFQGQPKDSLQWEEIILENRGGRILRLTDLATVRIKEQKPRAYFRINGLNTLYLNIYSASGANQIRVADQVYKKVEELKRAFPPNVSLLVTYDASKQLREETNKTLNRSGLAIAILLLFVLMVSRSLRYLLVIGISMVVNLAVAVIFYYWLKIEIHLYSLAGITVSLGIMIDNTIIMADHLRHHRNKKVFLALLGATLTTMGALVIVFFLKEEQRLNLVDFAWVMLVNLGVSLFIALFFIPALLEKIPLPVKKGSLFFRRKRRIIKITNRYSGFIGFTIRHKWALIILGIWGFGLPLFMLPNQLNQRTVSNRVITVEKPSWYEKAYNATLGNSTYVMLIKPWLDKIFGGSLYYFNTYMAEQNFNWDERRTQLTMNVSMPDGATLDQMNKVFLEFENFLAGFDEIDQFVSRIHGTNSSSMTITFRKEAENESFPYYLKQLLETKAVETDGADFTILGVGLGFSNALSDGLQISRISMLGYNYDELMKHARVLRDSLLTNPRIKEVLIRTDNSWWGKPRYEFVLSADQEALARTNSSLGEMYRQLSVLTQTDTRAGDVSFEKNRLPIVLRPLSNDDAGIWNLQNAPLRNRSNGILRLKDVGRVAKERTDGSINKRNQQYQVMVSYNFIGSPLLSSMVQKNKLVMINRYLPLGFSAESDQTNWWWDTKETKQYWLLFLVVGIIYLICAVLLESLWQPLAVIATIPLSFIGVFLVFAFFELPFNQGGYASMVLLCGITVNSALYIINDYNNIRNDRPRRSLLKNYLAAFNHKIIPILLTILSTSLGMLPFLIGGQRNDFWFSLAVGSIGGLLFSVVAIVVWLPLLMKIRIAGAKGALSRTEGDRINSKDSAE